MNRSLRKNSCAFTWMKQEVFRQYYDEQELYGAVENFAYVKYNHVDLIHITDTVPLLRHDMQRKNLVTNVTKMVDHKQDTEIRN